EKSDTWNRFSTPRFLIPTERSNPVIRVKRLGLPTLIQKNINHPRLANQSFHSLPLMPKQPSPGKPDSISAGCPQPARFIFFVKYT
ncbi:MAG: hypothetical protein NT172_21265, partial [Planctomycetota bacterium]|nr:hypothetical protein [Planctomycetota bacterium]